MSRNAKSVLAVAATLIELTLRLDRNDPLALTARVKDEPVVGGAAKSVRLGRTAKPDRSGALDELSVRELNADMRCRPPDHLTSADLDHIAFQQQRETVRNPFRRIDPQARIERRLGIAGVVVLETVPDSPAQKAGLRGLNQTDQGITIGDVIVGVGDQPVRNYDDLYNILDGKKPKGHHEPKSAG